MDEGTPLERIEYRNWFTGNLHRKNGPAQIWKNGRLLWIRNGYLHREDGPAIEWGLGYNEWYLEGDLYFEDAYKEEIFKRNLKKLNGRY